MIRGPRLLPASNLILGLHLCSDAILNGLVKYYPQVADPGSSFASALTHYFLGHATCDVLGFQNQRHMGKSVPALLVMVQ